MPAASSSSNGPYGKFKHRESLDLETLLGETNTTTLLSESSSLPETVSFTSLPCPPFPANSILPASNNDTNDNENLLQSAGPIAPTPPRLKKLAKVHRPIRDWAAELSEAEVPSHTPWEGQATESDTARWVPEGSLYSPDSFRKALSGARSRPLTSNPASKVAPPSGRLPSPPTAKRTSAANREGLVFEHRFSVQSGGANKRMSVVVPATDMDKEMVDMMLELRNLNAFFKTDVEGESSSTLRCSAQLEPPSLVISDSHCVLPLSLHSSGELDTSKSTVASRRGKAVRPLAIAPIHDDATYPGIPTAFLGTPSAYSPLSFDRPVENESKESIMNLEDMVGALRLRCAPLHAVFTKSGTHVNVEPEVAVPAFSDTVPSAKQDASMDEWAFADDLIKSFGEDTSLVLSSRTPAFDPRSPLLFDTSMPASMFSDIPGGSQASLSTPEGSPDLSLSPGSSSAPRSILKNRKSVRFASLPAAAEVPPVTAAVGKSNESAGRAPLRKGQRRGTTSSLPSATGRAFPLYSNVPPKHRVIPPGTLAIAPLTAKHGISGLKPKSICGTSSIVPVRPPRPPGPPVTIKRAVRTPSSGGAGTNSKQAMEAECVAGPQTPPSPSTSAFVAVPTPPSRAATLGRQSLKSIKSSIGGVGKENRSRAASLSPSVIARISGEVDVGKRSKGPLRNILTRFK